MGRRIGSIFAPQRQGEPIEPSSEIEYNDTPAVRIGEEGLEWQPSLKWHTTPDWTVPSGIGLMRQFLVQAVHHAQYREAFKRKLIDQPP